MEKTILYFEKTGQENTVDVLQAAKKRAKELGIKQVCVATTHGGTAIRAKKVFEDYKAEVIAVGIGEGFRENGWCFTEEERKRVQAAGMKLLMLPLPGASVTATDESTNIPRTVPTDAAGNFEIMNLRPGSYKVEVALEGFKKYERTGVVLKAASVARVDTRLEVGGMAVTVTVTAEGKNNITLESQAIARGLDDQQIRGPAPVEPRHPGLPVPQPQRGGRGRHGPPVPRGTHVRRQLHPGRAGLDQRDLRHGGQLCAPGVDAIAEVQVLSNSYSAEYGGLAGVVVTTKRGGNDYRGTAIYDFNDNNLNALTYGQKLTGATRDDPNADTTVHRWGASFGGPIKSEKTFFYANYEGLRDTLITGGGRATVPTEAMRNGDFSGASFTIKDPKTGLPFPGNIIPASRIDPSASNIITSSTPCPTRGRSRTAGASTRSTLHGGRVALQSPAKGG